jgi:phosphoribosylaminoimidazolecarboxamide formyltransferase / IMP cyclohydrolase
MTDGILKPRRALLSVYDKTGIIDLAKSLHEFGIELLSSGGTAKVIADVGIPVIEIGDYTSAVEMFSGRVKTLQPKIHGGILARRPVDNSPWEFPDDTAEMKKFGIPPIDIVCTNLYPFRETIAKPGVTLQDALEKIDIGGPAMVRAAAKNFQSVCIVTSPGQYKNVIEALNEFGGIPLAMREDFARTAFHLTAMYDASIARYFRCRISKDSDIVKLGEKIFPDNLPLGLFKIMETRYGENPHQKGAYYRIDGESADFITDSEILQGKEISYNNLLDIDSVVKICREFPGQICATVVKHQNPTGVAISESAVDAYRKARSVDELAAFGNVTGISGIVDEACALAIKEAFVEVVVALDFTPEAREILKKKKNLRLVKTNLLLPMDMTGRLEGKALAHGVLIQEVDTKLWDDENFKVVSKRQPSKNEMKAMELAWRVVKHVRSNATVLANSEQTVGTGPSQTSRIATFEIAIGKAGQHANGAVAATDGFCFADSVEVSHAAGVTAIIEPGGGQSDNDTIAKADELGIALVMTGMRHFKH